MISFKFIAVVIIAFILYGTIFTVLKAIFKTKERLLSFIGTCGLLFLLHGLYVGATSPQMIFEEKMGNTKTLVVDCLNKNFILLNEDGTIFTETPFPEETSIRYMNKFKTVIVKNPIDNSFDVDTFKNDDIVFVDNQYFRNWKDEGHIQQWR